jgi:hypothetical protein
LLLPDKPLLNLIEVVERVIQDTAQYLAGHVAVVRVSNHDARRVILREPFQIGARPRMRGQYMIDWIEMSSTSAIRSQGRVSASWRI